MSVELLLLLPPMEPDEGKGEEDDGGPFEKTGVVGTGINNTR